MIPPRVHGYLDYLIGGLLILIPLIFSKTYYLPSWILLGFGIGTILYSILTDYEMGIAGLISFKLHLIIDIIIGFFLALSPWVFGFQKEIFIPFLLLGIGEVIISLFTNRKFYNARAIF
ncbi:hypothetical protein APR41_10575 [Salegentibacter salinarum]|uniref:SPW repeat-containing integral membrane domain-containing protein n=1 Tax=Salegentibacter salinarum TaxID=447422 RepID=A0A2N0TNA2_9FLAO|nr:hypothetical protein APR41_10575 [Salegentibacter salinarum]SKB67755.1 hypothetical protein SAMN05660903_01989 [Salegentibacter salinarum]